MFGVKSNSQLRKENEKLRMDVFKYGKKISELQNKSSSQPAEDTLGDMILALPPEVFIKRIYSRKTDNKWLVFYRSGGTEYYGVTLENALGQLFKNNAVVAERYKANWRESHQNV